MSEYKYRYILSFSMVVLFGMSCKTMDSNENQAELMEESGGGDINSGSFECTDNLRGQGVFRFVIGKDTQLGADPLEYRFAVNLPALKDLSNMERISDISDIYNSKIKINIDTAVEPKFKMIKVTLPSSDDKIPATIITFKIEDLSRFFENLQNKASFAPYKSIQFKENRMYKVNSDTGLTVPESSYSMEAILKIQDENEQKIALANCSKSE